SSRPHTAAPSAPVDNRKERDRESKELHSRDKRSSKEISPLDHRGDHIESVEKKNARRPESEQQRVREVNSNSNGNSSSGSKPTHPRSPCLSGVIYPLISEAFFKRVTSFKPASVAAWSNALISYWTRLLKTGKSGFGAGRLQRRHHYTGRGPESSHKTDAIEELKNAFELAERASPGISDLFVREMVQKLLPTVAESRIKVAMDKITSSYYAIMTHSFLKAAALGQREGIHHRLIPPFYPSPTTSLCHINKKEAKVNYETCYLKNGGE
ncbi:unnamed protein product, partial [Timema podura]|nr:unnamed protein product [Timema podura]